MNYNNKLFITIKLISRYMDYFMEVNRDDGRTGT